MSLPSDRPLLEETPGDGSLVRLNVNALGEADVERVRARLFELAAERAGQDIKLDLPRLEYMTSTGLGLFVSLHKKVQAAGGRLSLHNLREPVYELFSVTRLNALLDVRRQGPEGEPSAASA